MGKHNGPYAKPIEERFWPKVDKNGPVHPPLGRCWIWTAATAKGYGVIGSGGHKGTNVAAHRFSYQLANGSIPAGLDLDHLCRNRRCVNPSHLEPVTRRVNLLRGRTIIAAQTKRTHCIHGHSLVSSNLYFHHGHRYCRTCRRERNRNRK